MAETKTGGRGAARGGRDARESRGLGRASTAIGVCEETDSVSSSLRVPARVRNSPQVGKTESTIGLSERSVLCARASIQKRPGPDRTRDCRNFRENLPPNFHAAARSVRLHFATDVRDARTCRDGGGSGSVRDCRCRRFDLVFGRDVTDRADLLAGASSSVEILAISRRRCSSRTRIPDSAWVFFSFSLHLLSLSFSLVPTPFSPTIPLRRRGGERKSVHCATRGGFSVRGSSSRMTRSCIPTPRLLPPHHRTLFPFFRTLSIVALPIRNCQ